MFALTRSKKSLFYCHPTSIGTLSTFFFAVTCEVTGFQSHTPLYEMRLVLILFHYLQSVLKLLSTALSKDRGHIRGMLFNLSCHFAHPFLTGSSGVRSHASENSEGSCCDLKSYLQAEGVQQQATTPDKPLMARVHQCHRQTEHHFHRFAKPKRKTFIENRLFNL